MINKVSLLVGLGNPGDRYAGSRHNIGFMVLDRLASRYGQTWKVQFRGQYSLISAGGIRCHLLKPLTYMNLSGEAVGELCRYFKTPPEETVVVHDELDYEFGKIKLRYGGSAGGHNGVRSVIDHLDTMNFGRIRMGVGGMPRTSIRGYVADYVLAPFTSAERETLDSFVDLGADAAECCLKEGFSNAMNEFNRKLASESDLSSEKKSANKDESNLK